MDGIDGARILDMSFSATIFVAVLTITAVLTTALLHSGGVAL
jgi:hypothetical protein